MGKGERKKTDERKKGEENYQDSRRKKIHQGVLPEKSVRGMERPGEGG
jgi:hypothetical protein